MKAQTKHNTERGYDSEFCYTCPNTLTEAEKLNNRTDCFECRGGTRDENT